MSQMPYDNGANKLTIRTSWGSICTILSLTEPEKFSQRATQIDSSGLCPGTLSPAITGPHGTVRLEEETQATSGLGEKVQEWIGNVCPGSSLGF